MMETQKESVKCIYNICLANHLIDIWRIRDPNVKRFTWCQKTSMIQRRLDFWLVSNVCRKISPIMLMQKDINDVDAGRYR